MISKQSMKPRSIKFAMPSNGLMRVRARGARLLMLACEVLWVAKQATGGVGLLATTKDRVFSQQLPSRCLGTASLSFQSTSSFCTL